MKNQFALFDWDNTVRRGYTLFSWLDYLCNNHYLSKNLQDEIELVKRQYHHREITHDQFADHACSLFAHYLKGIHADTINHALSKYIGIDQSFLLSGIDGVFQSLYTKNIDIIIISGAPELIINQYKNRFHIKSVYGFKEECVSRVYTGNVSYNYGFNKEVIVNKLCEQYSRNPIIAFGDSESDIPMLKAAKYPFCIGTDLHLPFHAYIVKNSVISEDIMQLISSIR